MKQLLVALICSMTAAAASAASLSAGRCRPMNSELCMTRISVHGDRWPSSPNLAVFVTHKNRTRLFACFGPQGGSQVADWIAINSFYKFTLVEAQDCYGSYGQILDTLYIDRAAVR